MKKTTILATAFPLLLLISCGPGHNNTGSTNDTLTEKKEFPKPGTIVASAEMPITEDKLNHFTFSVKVIADSNVQQGVYDVDADFGPNFASGQFVMPKGGEDLKPVIRKGSAPYTFIIGFKVPDDTTFYDYFEVSSNRKTTVMKYVKVYSF